MIKTNSCKYGVIFCKNFWNGGVEQIINTRKVKENTLTLFFIHNSLLFKQLSIHTNRDNKSS